MTHTIYIGSTNQPNIFHIGQTDRRPEDRWKDADYGKLPYVIQRVATYTVPKSLTDGKIHKFLDKTGKVFRTKTVMDTRSDEIFIVADVITDPVSYIKQQVGSAINQITNGVTREHSYKMREEQQACHDKVINHFVSGGNRFLINAKMRYGKTFTTYQIAKTLNARRILVLTYKPAVDDSWRNDLENHIDFNDWKYYSTKSNQFSSVNPIELPGTGVEVLFSSFQDFNDFGKSKWQNAVDYHYDLVIVDEMHYGSDTKRAQAALERLSFDRILYVSGTPLRELFAGTFLDQEVFTWSYVQEQAKRREEKESGWTTENYRWLPEMQFHTYEVNDQAKQLIEAYSDEEGFTMTKMFGSDDGNSFIEPGAVTLFLDQVFGIAIRAKKSPIKQFACDHILMVLPPSVKSVNAMCKMLVNRVGDHYAIINVAGDNVTSLDKVRSSIGFNKKTITVTCGRFNTGVTVPEWDMVLMLDDGHSAETYFQTIFRVQSPDQARGKEICYVVDYNPQRLVEVVYEYAALTAEPDESIETSLRKLLEFAPILDHSDNKPIRVEVEDVLEIMVDTGGLEAQFGSASLFRWANLTQVADALATVSPDATSKTEKQVSDNDIELGKNYETIGDRKSTQRERDEERQLRQMAITMMKSLPAYLHTDPQSDCRSIVSSGNAEKFLAFCQITLEQFCELLDRQFVNEDRVDRCIHALMSERRAYS